MSHNLESYLIGLFPDVFYITEGLDAGKWMSGKYKFNLKCSFYTELASGKTYFVKNGKWKTVLNDLKIKENEASDAIVKGND